MKSSPSWQMRNASHEIYIDLQLLPPAAMDTKLIVLIAAGEAPDVIALSEERFNFFLEQGALLALGQDEAGSPIYGVQHPAQLSTLVVWGDPEYPEEALEVLHYFQNIPHGPGCLRGANQPPSIWPGTGIQKEPSRGIKIEVHQRNLLGQEMLQRRTAPPYPSHWRRCSGNRRIVVFKSAQTR